MKPYSRVGRVCIALLALALLATPAFAKTTIELWEPWGTTVIKDALEPFLAQNPDIEVNITPSGQNINQRNKLLTAMAAGLPPDIVIMVSPIADIALQGVVTPLDNLLAKSNVIKAKDYPAGLLDLFKINGATYGIPAIEVGPWLGMAINADLMEAAGMPAKSPDTLDNLLRAHKKLTRMEGDQLVQLGFSPLDAMGDLYCADTWPIIFGQTLYNQEKQTLAIDTPNMRTMLNYLRSFHDNVTADQIYAFHSKQIGWFNNSMNSGKLALQINGYWTPGSTMKSGATERFRYVYDWVPNTRGDKLMTMGGWGMTIPKGAAHVNEAFRIIEYFTTLEPAQIIYDKNGWLNGNLAAMRRLNTGKNQGIQFFMQALSTANRLVTAENIPIMRDVRDELKKVNWAVAKGQVGPEQALPDLQRLLSAKLDEMLKRK